jgi:hypothetical protein
MWLKFCTIHPGMWNYYIQLDALFGTKIFPEKRFGIELGYSRNQALRSVNWSVQCTKPKYNEAIK